MSSPDTGPAEARLDAKVAAIDARLDAAGASFDVPVSDSPPVIARQPLKDRAVEAGKKIKGRAIEDGEKIGEKIKDAAEYVATPDFTFKDIGREGSEEEQRVAQDLLAAYKEIELRPERASEILEAMDADAILMKKIIDSRSGIRGAINRLDEKLSIKGFRLSSVLGSAIVAKGLGIGETALKLSNPLAGAVTGGVIGGIWGYVGGRKKQESVSQWLADVNVGNMTKDDFDKMSPAELDMALGVINNAVHNKKVRGGTSELRQMVQTYRCMKEYRARMGKAEIERDPAKDVLEKIDLATETEGHIGKALTDKASEKYKGLYEEITSGKQKQIWGSALKGAAVGAAVGGVLGWAVSKLAGATHGGTHGQESQLQGKEQALRVGEHAQHVDIIDQAKQVQAGASASPEQALLFQQHADIIQHSNNLIAQHGRIEGFAQQGIDQLGQHLNSNSSYWNLVKEAGLNNIDLTATTGNGQTLGNFLITNKEAFVHLTPELQRQVLSFPSLAPEIMASAVTATAAGTAATAEMAAAVVGGVALGVVGSRVGSAGKEKVRESYDKANTAGKTEAEAIEARIKAAGEGEKKKADEEEEKRLTGFEANLAAAKTELIGKEIWLAEYPNRLYRVAAIDAEGQLGFVYTEADKVKLQSDEEVELPHPDVNIEDLVNENGNLDISKVKITYTEARVERRPVGRTETAELQELASGGDFVKVTLTKVTRKVGPAGDRKDREFWAIKLASNTVVTIESKNANTICAGKKSGDKVEVKIDHVESMKNRPQSVYNVTLSLKPKEEPKPVPDKPGGPKPAEDRAKQMEAYFSPEGVIDEDNLDTMDEAVGEFAATMTDPKKKAPRVVVSKPDGLEFYMLVAVADEKYTAYPYDTLNQKPDLSKKTEVTARDLTNGWKLFVGKGGSENE